MATTVRHKDGVTILEPAGKIMGTSVSELRETITTEVDASDTPKILIDFEKVNMMDSSGLGTLMGAHVTITRKGGRVGVLNVGKNIKNLIVRSRLASIFEHFNTEDEAIFSIDNRKLKHIYIKTINVEDSPMAITQSQRDGVTIFKLDGRIIAPHISEVTDLVEQELKKMEDPPNLVFDFKDVTSMDSSGLGAIMKIYTDVQPRGGSIAVINVNKHVKNLIVMARLITVFQNFESEEDAVNALLNPLNQPKH